MHCLVFDVNKSYIGSYEYFTTEHVNNFIINYPEAKYFFMTIDSPADGLYRMSSDDLSVERGHYEDTDNSTYVSRTFWWEKYTEPDNVPEGLESQVAENLKWIYNGGAEENVPNPMPETQTISFDIVESWVVDEVIIPDELIIS